MTQFSIAHGQFESDAEAIALAEAAGLTALALNIESSGLDHWHDFGASVYVVEGSVKITAADTGEQCELVAGSSIIAKPGVVHREEGQPYRAVVGFDCDPSSLSMPIDKSPAELPS